MESSQVGMEAAGPPRNQDKKHTVSSPLQLAGTACAHTHTHANASGLEWLSHGQSKERTYYLGLCVIQNYENQHGIFFFETSVILHPSL